MMFEKAKPVEWLGVFKALLVQVRYLKGILTHHIAQNDSYPCVTRLGVGVDSDEFHVMYLYYIEGLFSPTSLHKKASEGIVCSQKDMPFDVF